MSRSAQALFVFLHLLILGSVISEDVVLSSVAVAKTGVPLHIVGVISTDSQNNYLLEMKRSANNDVTFSPPSGVLNSSSVSFDTVVLACPQEEPFDDITASLSIKGAPTRGGDPVELKIGLENGAQLAKELQLVREGNKIKTTLKIKNVIFEAPIYDLSCSFDSSTEMDGKPNLTKIVYRQGKPVPKPVEQPSCTDDKCMLGNMLGLTELVLKAVFNDPTPAIFSLNVSCNATFGLKKCPSVLIAHDTLHPGVIFDVPPSVIAGNNLTLKISGVEDIQDCTITLPNAKDYHLASGVSGCTQSGQNITCHVNKSVEVPVHLDSSASAAKNDFFLKCAKITAVQKRTVDVKVESGVDTVAFGGFLRVLKPARFNVSLIVTNKGPSDLKDLQCTLTYDDDFGELSKAFHPDDKCSKNHSYVCSLHVGTVPGFDAKGKPGKVNYTVTMEHVSDPIWEMSSSHFTLNCNNKIIERDLGKNDTDFVVIGKPPVETPMQNDGYFWTYAIVIVNLFVIALVVFVGMWWRNRAIAKTMEGRGGAGGFTEMEIFSEGGGRLPMSKAD